MIQKNNCQSKTETGSVIVRLNATAWSSLFNFFVYSLTFPPKSEMHLFPSGSHSKKLNISITWDRYSSVVSIFSQDFLLNSATDRSKTTVGRTRAR